ncbi:MAG TPA: hypothetical protein VHT97_07600 [Acidimicrobiales bacterium]|jgi:hypothetical protein|nr:hypothetical protein [Acidimicrobiales bacterium]
MTSNFLGRIETRLFVVATVGLLWTLLITPFLPLPTGSDRFTITLRTLGLVAVLGVVVWEPIYHLLQQFRWEKDWPAMFLLLQMVNEGILVRLVLDWTVSGSVGLGTFILHFATTWLAIYLFLQGPMRVPFLRWRFRGGRIL